MEAEGIMRTPGTFEMAIVFIVVIWLVIVACMVAWQLFGLYFYYWDTPAAYDCMDGFVHHQYDNMTAAAQYCYSNRPWWTI
jgi:hypothetical protein